MKLKQKIIILSSFGFGVGVLAGTLLAALLGSLSAGDGTLHLCASELVDAVGNPLTAFIIQALASGLFGVLAVGGSAIYSVEKWSLVKVTVIHYLMVMVGYYVLAFSVHWLSFSDPVPILIIFVMMTAGYVMIWLFNYLSYRKQLEEINKELDEFKHEPHEGEE